MARSAFEDFLLNMDDVSSQESTGEIVVTKIESQITTIKTKYNAKIRCITLVAMKNIKARSLLQALALSNLSKLQLSIHGKTIAIPKPLIFDGIPMCTA